jgi:hypothetical protein
MSAPEVVGHRPVVGEQIKTEDDLEAGGVKTNNNSRSSLSGGGVAANNNGLTAETASAAAAANYNHYARNLLLVHK